MRSILLLLAAAIFAAIAFPASTSAAEPTARFVAQLERLELHELALTYLEGLAARQQLPAEMRQTLPLDQAGVHVRWARRTFDPTAAEQHLLAARRLYTGFRADHAGHARSIEAGRQLGFVLAELGRRKLAQARQPARAAQRGQLEQESRAYFAAALEQADVSVRELEVRLKELPL